MSVSFRFKGRPEGADFLSRFPGRLGDMYRESVSLFEQPPAAVWGVIAARVASPTFEIKLLRQRYTRLSRNRYRYESGNGFRSQITIDPHGLVVNYPPGWQRVAVRA